MQRCWARAVETVTTEIFGNRLRVENLYELIVVPIRRRIHDLGDDQASTPTARPGKFAVARWIRSVLIFLEIGDSVTIQVTVGIVHIGIQSISHFPSIMHAV